MSAGALTQLAAKGVQDKNLTLSPEITFFKGVWKHHTNFACESITQTFSAGQMKLGNTVTAQLPRKGDLVHDIWLEIDMSRIGNYQGCSFNGWKEDEQIGGWGVSYVPEVARAMIEKVEIMIGGHTFDTHSAEWLHAYDELCIPRDKQPMATVGKANSKTEELIDRSGDDQKFYMPLRFWFNNEMCQALPIVALMYHEVDIKVKLRSQKDLLTINRRDNVTADEGTVISYSDDTGAVRGHKTFAQGGATANPPGAFPSLSETKSGLSSPDLTDKAVFSFPEHGGALIDMKLLINYVFLDKQERELFAKSDHYYLVDTVTEVKPTWQPKQKLQVYDIGEINHPCKDLIWCVRPQTNTQDAAPAVGEQDQHGAGQGLFKWDMMIAGGSGIDPPSRFYTTGGHVKDYFDFRGSSYKNGQFESFESAKLVLNGSERFHHDARFLREVSSRDKYPCVPRSMVYAYPFAKDPCDWKPSGSLNFSRVDQARFELDLGEYAQRNASKGAMPQSDVFVFARVHNIVKITAGMAGLMYAN
jgi:hypothetical protein